MKINLTISKMVALGAIVLTSVLLPTEAKAGGRSIFGQSSIALDDRDVAPRILPVITVDPKGPVREPLPPISAGIDPSKKKGNPNTKKVGPVPDPVIRPPGN